MGRKIICPGCNTIFDEDILKQKNSENTCLVCGANLGENGSHIEQEELKTDPEDEMTTWYYYDLGGGNYYLDNNYIEETKYRHVVYQFRAPNDLNKAKVVLKKEYNPNAFSKSKTNKYKFPQQLGDESHCPRCGSSNLQIVPRKWSFLTGFLTNKVDRVCVNCKHRF